MPYKPSETSQILVTFTCEHSTPRVFCQDPPHKNLETHTFFSTRLINNAYESRLGMHLTSRRDTCIIYK